MVWNFVGDFGRSTFIRRTSSTSRGGPRAVTVWGRLELSGTSPISNRRGQALHLSRAKKCSQEDRGEEFLELDEKTPRHRAKQEARWAILFGALTRSTEYGHFPTPSEEL